MTETREDAVYSLRSIEEMLGLSRPVILGLVDAGFVSPARGPRNSYRFTFQDVVLLRTAQSLIAADLPARRIVRSLKRLRQLLPAAVPLAGLRITAVGDDVAVREAGQNVAVESGQFLFDFQVAPAGSVLAFPTSVPAEDDAATWLSRAAAADAADDRATAIAAYRRVVALEPASSDGWLGLGAALHETRALRRALDVYDQAIARVPDDAALHYNRAIVLEDLGRPADALEGYEACVRLSPDFADAHWNAARLYEERGIVKQALRHFSAYRRLQR